MISIRKAGCWKYCSNFLLRRRPLSLCRKSIVLVSLFLVAEKLFTLQVSDIAYFYSENKLTFAVTHKNREYLIDLALDRLSEQLDPDHFFRTNRQTLVCIDAIQRIESYFLGKAIVHVQPPFKDKIMISKDKMASFRMWLNY